MLEDPKDPNAWWAVRLKLVKLFPEKLTPAQKRNPALIGIPLSILCLIELYYLSKYAK
jgi:hypothetical protein